MSYPTREDRHLCWGARDKYWECLDKNGILESDGKTEGPCEKLRAFYEKYCTPQWVKHFDRKRSYLKFKEKIEKDGIPNKTTNEQKLFEKRRVYHKIACS